MTRALALFFIPLFTFYGCSSEDHRLSFSVGGAPSEVDYWESLIGEFERTYNIKVNLLRQPTDTDQRRQGLVIPLKAKQKDPDVFLLDIAWISQFSVSGWLEPLDAYIRETGFEVESIFQPVIEQSDTSPEGIIALPVYLDCGLLYYRKDLLEKYGCDVPETWDHLVATSLKIQEQEQKRDPMFFGFVWQGAQYEGLICNFLEHASSRGGGFGDLSREIFSLKTRENEAALTFMRDLIHKYKISPPNVFTEMREEEARMYFQNQRALFERNWPYAWELHQAGGSPVKGKVGMSVLPSFDGGTNAATLGGWHIGVSRFSDRKDEAWKLISFIMSFDVQKKLALDLGWNPGRKDVYDDPEIREKKPEMTVLKAALENAVARPNVPYYTLISSILQRYAHGAIAGKMDPAEALSKAEAEIRKAITSYDE